MQERILSFTPEADYRAYVISDIHGHGELLKKLLRKLNLKQDDYLIILGDFINRGIDSVETYTMIRELEKRPRTFVLKGNHELFIQSVLQNAERYDDLLEFLKADYYETIIGTMLEHAHMPVHTINSVDIFADFIQTHCKEIIQYFETMPFMLQFDDYIFVHGGYDPSFKGVEDEVRYLKYDDFNTLSPIQSKTIVVGHWPTCNFREDRIDNAPYFNPDKNLIFVDGGVGVKSTGEMNALCIERRGQEKHYSCIQTDMFQTAEILSERSFESEPPVYVNYPHQAIEVESHGPEYTACKHVYSGKRFRVFNALLVKSETGYELKMSYLNNFLDLKRGDCIKICHRVENYVLVKHQNQFGWICADQITL